MACDRVPFDGARRGLGHVRAGVARADPACLQHMHSWPPISTPSARKCWRNFFPAAKQMGALFDPKTTGPHRFAEVEYTARLLGVRLTTHRVERKEDIPAAIER